MKNLLFSLMVFTSISYGWVGTVTDSSNGNTLDIRPQADLSDADEEGNFVWITGEPLNWTNWWGSEPSANDYVHTRGGNGTSGREWMARQNTHRIGYFVEFYVNVNGDIY